MGECKDLHHSIFFFIAINPITITIGSTYRALIQHPRLLRFHHHQYFNFCADNVPGMYACVKTWNGRAAECGMKCGVRWEIIKGCRTELWSCRVYFAGLRNWPQLMGCAFT